MKTAILSLFVLLPVFAQPAWRDQAMLETAPSPKARLHGVPVRSVAMGDGFWSQRRKVNVDTSIPTLLELLQQNGIVYTSAPPFRPQDRRRGAGRSTRIQTYISGWKPWLSYYKAKNSRR